LKKYIKSTPIKGVTCTS